MSDFLTDDEIEIGELDNLHEKIKELKSDCLQIIKDIKIFGVTEYKSGNYGCNFCSMSKRKPLTSCFCSA